MECALHAGRMAPSGFEFDWPSNAGLQRFLWPIIWVSPWPRSWLTLPPHTRAHKVADVHLNVAVVLQCRWSPVRRRPSRSLTRCCPSPCHMQTSVPSPARWASTRRTAPLINVGYGRPDVTGPDPFQGVGSNTNQQRDYPIQEIINEWGEATSGPSTAKMRCKCLCSAMRSDPLHVSALQKATASTLSSW